jgi:hypothetical protein
MEMNFAYHVNAHFAEVEATVRTNNPTIAIKEFLGHVEDGTHCDIVSGVTGEVLAIANCEDHADYATDEMALMVLGYLYATENQPTEPAGIPELPDPSAVDNATVSQDTITNLQELAKNGNLLASSLLGLLS